MRSSNAFETLGLKVNPKALFENFSHEAYSITQDERILTFAHLVWAGYHIKDEAYRYLTEKQAPKGFERYNTVHRTLLSVGFDVVMRVHNRYHADRTDRDIIDLLDFIKSQGHWKKIRKLSFEKYADTLEEILSKCFSMREKLLADIGERPPYHPLLEPWDLGFIYDRIIDRDRRLELDTSTNSWSYKGLYDSWKQTTLKLLEETKSYNLPTHIEGHLNPQIWDASTYRHSELALAKKYFPVEDTELLKGNDKAWRERVLAFATKHAEAIWLQSPLFDEPVYVWYTNYTDKQALHTDRLHKEAIVSICVQDYAQTGNDEGHQEYFDMLVAGKSMARPKKGKYIQDFISLANRVKEQDVLVVASYKGHQDLRIGLIKQGTEFYVEQYEGYRLYCFKLKSVYCTPRWGMLHASLNPADYPILKNLSPNSGTIHHVVNQRKRQAVYRAYYGIVYPYHYSLLSDEATEDMCKLWLTSEHAEAYDLYLLRPAPMYGGTTHIVDIWGISYGDIEILAQITTSNNTSLIEKKEKKLLTLSKHNTKCVVFANYLFNKEHENWGENRYRISLRHVWQDLYDGSEEEKEKMQALCQIEYKQTK